MTISTTVAKSRYAGDGSTTLFPTGFKFIANGHVRVLLRAADGSESLWSEGSEYSLTGAGQPDGGTVEVATSPVDHTPGAGETLVVKLAVPPRQDTSLPLGGAFPSTAVESMADLAALRDQQIEEALSRAPKLKETSALADVAFPEPEAGRPVGWNAAGDALENLEAIGRWQGDWTTDTDYVALDVVRDGDDTGNLYVCDVAHISGTLATDIATGKWSLALDVEAVTTAQAAAETAQVNAETAQAAAATSATASETARAAAETAETNAAGSATAAAGSATAAADSAATAFTAATAAGTAETAAEAAQAAAETAETNAETAATTATGQATAAVFSATAAAASETAAETAQAAAEALYEDLEAVQTAATAAATSAAAAAASETAAEAAETNAETAAATATTQASAAATSATNAAASATAAAAAETSAETAQAAAETAQAAAETAQAAAETAETNAGTSATAAAGSASTASTAATAAGTSATAAAASETAAETAKAAAEAAQTAAEAAQATAEAAAADGIAIVPRGAWSAGTSYSTDDGVTHLGSFWRSLQGGNQGNTPGSAPTQWELSVSKGDQGAQGEPGADGADGVDGADGLFSQIASQSEAEGGTDNTKGMTALRTAQAIAALGGGGGGGIELLASANCAGLSTVQFLEIDELGAAGEFVRFLFVIDHPIFPSSVSALFFAEIGEYGGANWETGSYVAFGHAVTGSPADQAIWRETNRILLCPAAGMGREVAGQFWYSPGVVVSATYGRPRWTWQMASSTYCATGGGGWNFGDYMKNDVRFRVSTGSMSEGRILLFGVHA